MSENENLFLQLTAEEAVVVCHGLMLVSVSDMGPTGDKAMEVLKKIRDAIIVQQMEEL